MLNDEFQALSKTLVTRCLCRHHLPDLTAIEIAHGENGVLHYTARVDMHGKLIEFMPDHPIAKAAVRGAENVYGSGR